MLTMLHVFLTGDFPGLLDVGTTLLGARRVAAFWLCFYFCSVVMVGNIFTALVCVAYSAKP